MIQSDTLRPPFSFDSSASAYKDWLHLNFVDPASETVGLVNVSLHGSPWDDRARSMGTLLLNSPERGWVSHVEIMAYSEANIGPSGIGLRDVALAIDARNGAIHVSTVGTSNPFHSRIVAEPASRSLAVEQEMPLGSGWISWYLVPRMRVSGAWSIANQATMLKDIPAYHDHNWGRWHWGDDFGWEWGCFLADPQRPTAPSLVFARTTDRSHHRRSSPFLLADLGTTRRQFPADSIKVNLAGEFSGALHRVPGAMAALHQEMAEPTLPESVDLIAMQGADRVHIWFVARAAAQFITADPVVRGYGFIHEVVGKYSCVGSLAGSNFESQGYAVFEYVT